MIKRSFCFEKSEIHLPVSIFAFLLFAASCAIQVAPTGGEKDETAPTVKKSAPENFSTNFTGQDISISFDEYITLKDLSTQFVVSPPLKYQPEARVKKKTLHIHLEDTLQENTTYTMNFGNSITDIREGNPVENYQYVFSTGNVLDSLTISGMVLNAFDQKTEKGIHVMLYRKTDDSLPLKTLPDYFARTTEEGTFEIKNVSPGRYKIFALKDNNSNYLFDNNEEVVAFSMNTVEAGTAAVKLNSFKEARNQLLLKTSHEEPGHVTIAYSQPLAGEKIIFLTDTSALQLYSTVFSAKRDTITLWYRNIQSDSLSFILQRDTVVDTVSTRLRRFETKFKSRTDFSLSVQYPSKTEVTLDLIRPLQLVFNHPIDSFDLGKVVVTEDSTVMKNVNLFFSDSLKRNLTLDFPKKENTHYKVEFPAGTFKDILALRNDSVQLLFRTKSISDYGTMAIQLTSLGAAKHYIVQLIDDKEAIYRQSFIYSDTTLNYDFLDPKNYRLKLIEDLNKNNEWDTGNYMQNQQPERVFYYKENFTVRSNWDVEVSWSVVSSQ